MIPPEWKGWGDSSTHPNFAGVTGSTGVHQGELGRACRFHCQVAPVLKEREMLCMSILKDVMSTLAPYLENK